MTTTSRKKGPLPPLPADGPLLTGVEVAALLRTTRRQVSVMVRRGQLPAPLQIAGLGLRWRRPSIEEYLAGL